MNLRVPACTLALLAPALVWSLSPTLTPEAPEQLCGHYFVRALVRACGGPRWAPEGRHVAGGDRQLLQWLGRRHLLQGLVSDGDAQPLPQVAQRHRHHRAAPANPARRCCLFGCTQRDLRAICPH
ncbi:Insulin-like 3 [Tupaia chinensis]|uniref:Insulin-like 3 n=2 Tax=Tupaia chinensis TaxID=246437 RepID=L9KWU1_TUPCH|nr:Insulin-like 3 [Tupaia chinensis]